MKLRCRLFGHDVFNTYADNNIMFRPSSVSPWYLMMYCKKCGDAYLQPVAYEPDEKTAEISIKGKLSIGRTTNATVIW